MGCWVVPLVMFVRYYYDADEGERPDVSILEWVVMAAEMALGLVLMVLGTKSSVETIVSKWQQYGYPFECHCQGLWNTCACSSDHYGMDWCEVTAFASAALANASAMNTTLANGTSLPNAIAGNLTGLF